MTKLTAILFFAVFVEGFALGQGYPYAIPPTNMVWIYPGTFTMGSPETEAVRGDEEGPQTQVTLTQGFYMGMFEVTQEEYLSIMGTNPSHFTGKPNLPVESVSWDDAVKYCAALTQRERQTGRLAENSFYRLPTEAEWEYACRAGTTTPLNYSEAVTGSFGTHAGWANFNGYYEYPPCRGDAYYCFNTTGWGASPRNIKHPMKGGTYHPNAWGLYDMHGNVGEWCQDWWDIRYPGGDATDPCGSPTGGWHVFRGGSWASTEAEIRSAARGNVPIRPEYVGFRVVLIQRTKSYDPFTVQFETNPDIKEMLDEAKIFTLKMIGGSQASYTFTIETSSNLIDWVTCTDVDKMRSSYVKVPTFVGYKPTKTIFYRAVAR